MITLRFRDVLPAAVVDELDSLVSQLKAWALHEHNEDGTHRPPDEITNLVPVGFIGDFAGTVAPPHWLICDGSLVSRVRYANLFRVIGTTYGAGDGQTTFALPNAQRRFTIGKAASGAVSTLGATGGAFDHSHSGGTVSGSTGNSAPGISGSTGTAAPSTDGSTLFFGNFATTVDANLDGTTKSVVNANGTSSMHDHDVDDHEHDAGTLAVASHAHSAGTLAVGTSGTANPPYLVLNKIIKT